jgi:hypothetical protein
LKGLHLSFVFPPLREGKKQKVAETDNFLSVLVSGYDPDGIFLFRPVKVYNKHIL